MLAAKFKKPAWQILLAAFLVACGNDQNDTVCPSAARKSIDVFVADSMGQPISDFAIAYELDGEPKTEFCLGMTCTPYPVEVAGDFLVTVTKAGYFPESKAVTVKKGICNVEAEQVLFVLRPSS